MTDLKCNGLYRMPNERYPVVEMRLTREPTDDELRKIHDAVRSALNPSEPATPSKVVRLHDGQPQQEPGVPSQGLISALTQTLELAQSGRLQALWGTGFTSDGLRFVLKGGRHEDVYQMAGAIAFLGDEYRDEVLTKNRKD